MFKQFLIRLKQNLREEDNLSTRDKWHVLKVSFVRRFYCINNFTTDMHQAAPASTIWRLLPAALMQMDYTINMFLVVEREIVCSVKSVFQAVKVVLASYYG